MEKITCPLCGCDVEITQEDATACPICGYALKEAVGEQKIMEAAGTYTTEDKQFFGKMGTNATLYLTDRRFLAIPTKLEGFNRTSVLTAAIINKMTSQYGVVSIPFDQIKAVREGKFGLLGKAFIIDTKDGELFKLTVHKQAVWMDALREAMPKK